MNIKKIMPLVLAGMVLTACGGGNTSETSSATPSTSTPSSNAPVSSVSEESKPSEVSSAPKITDVTVDFWHTFGQGIENGVEEYVKEFEKIIKEKEGVNVKINMSKEGSYTDIQTKISKGLGAGNIPTLAVAYPDHVAAYMAAEPTPGKYVVNLDKYMDDKNVGFGTEKYLGDIANDGTVYGKDDFIKVFMDEGTCYAKEGTYSIPFMKSTEVMFYNMNMVKKAMQYHNPAIANSESQIADYMNTITWNDLLDIAKVIKEHKSQIAPSLEYPIFYDSDGNFFVTQMYQNKIPYSSFDKDGKGQIDFESTENLNKTVSMLDSLRQAHKDGLLTTKGTKGEYSSYSFTDELCAFAIGSSGGAGYNNPSSDSFTFGVAPVPYANNNPTYVSQGVTLTVLKNPSYSEEMNEAKCLYAWKFAKFLTNPDVNAVLCIEDSQGYVPVRDSAYESSDYIEFLSDEDNIYSSTCKVVMDLNSAADYINSPVFSGSSKLREQCGGIITTLFKGDDRGDNVDTKTIVSDAIKAAKTYF